MAKEVEQAADVVTKKFDHWWTVVNNTLAVSPTDKEMAHLMYMFGFLEGFEQHDKVTEAAVKAAIAEIREGL